TVFCIPTAIARANPAKGDKGEFREPQMRLSLAVPAVELKKGKKGGIGFPQSLVAWPRAGRTA
ncbi:hypothetical protein, partial [Thermosynechococcus sp. M3746_W2019_013]|uniref:hypothetical protein n=1 Tax=Thermosynechococcus sp. M3746_W2019_013 TaxID=2747806 RepID=UPI0025FD2B94